MIGKGGRSLTIWDAFVRLKDIPESDIKQVEMQANRDAYTCVMWNHRRVELTGMEVHDGVNRSGRTT